MSWRLIVLVALNPLHPLPPPQLFDKLQPGGVSFGQEGVSGGELLPRKPVGIPGAVTPSERVPKARTSASFVTAAVQTVGPAVVRIDTEHTVEANEGLLPLLEDPVFKKFFEHELRKNAREPPLLQRGQGSGFIVSAEGLLITNAHVVKGAHKVTVTLTDGRSYTATVKGTDDLLDLAVLKIDNKGKNLPVAPLGISSDLQVGDWVIAVGNPVGLDNTVTLGIVSSLNRSSAEIGIPEKRLNFIQTDAAINVSASAGSYPGSWSGVCCTVGCMCTIACDCRAAVLTYRALSRTCDVVFWFCCWSCPHVVWLRCRYLGASLAMYVSLFVLNCFAAGLRRSVWNCALLAPALGHAAAISLCVHWNMCPNGIAFPVLSSMLYERFPSSILCDVLFPTAVGRPAGQ